MYCPHCGTQNLRLIEEDIYSIEAFWMASAAAGVLYVLKGDSYVRISIGGPGNQQTKIEKSKTLAKK